MDLYVISYDLHLSEREEYDELYEAIHDLGSATPVAESTWIVAAEGVTHAAICNHLKDFIDSEDKLVARVAVDAPTPEISSANLDEVTRDAMRRVLWWTH